MTVIPWLVAGLLVLPVWALAASPADPGTGLAALENRCSKNHQAQAFSCIQLGDGNEPTLYVDTGLVDGRAGIWKESNKQLGLQKDPYRVGQTLHQPDEHVTNFA